MYSVNLGVRLMSHSSSTDSQVRQPLDSRATSRPGPEEVPPPNGPPTGSKKTSGNQCKRRGQGNLVDGSKHGGAGESKAWPARDTEFPAATTGRPRALQCGTGRRDDAGRSTW